MMKLYQAVPHPFVIEPPLRRQGVFQRGESLEFTLTLIGRARDYLPYFVLAFKELGEIGLGTGLGKYELMAAHSDDNQENHRIYETLSSRFGECPSPIDIGLGNTPNEDDQLELKFHTPTRIIYREQLAAHPEFHVLMRALLRRVSAIAYFHCGTPPELDFKSIVEQAQEVKIIGEDIGWFDWERYSNRQKTRMKMGGFLGTATYEGPWKNFLPLLKLGELVHIGKGATFGLGKYSIG